MAGYDMKYRSKWEMDREGGSQRWRGGGDNIQSPGLLYNMFNQPKKSQHGMPQSLFDLLINRRMGFNIGDKGYMNLRFPEGWKRDQLKRSGYGVDLTYDF